MTIFVGLILVSLFFFSSAIQEPTIPWAGFVYVANPDRETPTKLDLPPSDEDGLCAIWVNLTATQKNPIHPLEGVSTLSTIDLRFEHPNFRETEKDHVMNIEHDGDTKMDIHICFYKCPTILDQKDLNIFTLAMTTENIPKENHVDLEVTSEKSLSYIDRCSYRDGTLVDDKKEKSGDDKGTTDESIETNFLRIVTYGVLPLVLFWVVVYKLYIYCRSKKVKDDVLPRPVPCSGSDTSGSENHNLPREPRGENIELPQIGGSLAEAIAGSSAISVGVKFGDRGNVRSAGKKSKKDD